jgi:hypothetical protein
MLGEHATFALKVNLTDLSRCRSRGERLDSGQHEDRAQRDRIHSYRYRHRFSIARQRHLPLALPFFTNKCHRTTNAGQPKEPAESEGLEE